MKQSRFTVGQIIKALKENEQDCTEVSDTKSDTLNFVTTNKTNSKNLILR